MDALSAEFIELGRALADAELYSKAYEVFLVAITRNPALAIPHYTEVRELLEKYNTELVLRQRMEDIFTNFEKVMKIYPADENLLNDIGKYLFKYEYYNEACNHFAKVLHMNSRHVMAEKNLNSVKNVLVERWHFRMLNDNLRNEAYRQAIKGEIIANRDKVIDVGTGTGLLAIYAYEGGANNIVACDGSRVMTEIARKIIAKNRLNEVIHLLNKMSTAMDKSDLKTSHNPSGEATILITEMFDAGLFGEHVLQMLMHAWPTLLHKQARIIPHSAEFFISGAQCNNLNMKYQMSSQAKTTLNLENENIHVLALDETYDCEDVHLQRNIKYLTDPQSVLTVNFNDLKDVEMHLNRTEPYGVDLKVIHDGTMNIVIGWFNLYLSDTITITTNPISEFRANAWQQAVFFDELPRTVKDGDSLKLEFFMNGGHFTLKQSTDAKITRVSPEIVRFVNDKDYIDLIISTIPVASVYLCQIADITQIRIVDLCPFPIFGMLMMKRGASSLICCAKNKGDKIFFIHVFKQNGIPLTNITILLGNDWTIEDFRGEKYHAIFTHILELGGDIDTRLRTIAVKLKTHHLHNSGLYMPAEVGIVGELISSRWLDINNKLYDVNVSRFKMAEYVNQFKVSINYFVDISTLKYVTLSEPTMISAYSEGLAYETTSVIKDGFANAILCTYRIELMNNIKTISTNRPNSFMDGMLFMTKSKPLAVGLIARIIYCRDEEGAFKLAFDVTGIADQD